MLQSRKHEAHAYNSCLGLLRLGKQDSYGSKRLEKPVAWIELDDAEL